jgi:hypothetical protein
MENAERQQMLRALMEVKDRKEIYIFCGFCSVSGRYVMTHASIIHLQDVLVLPVADEVLQYNLKKDSNLKVRAIFENPLRVLEMPYKHII